ncbi:MAG: calcium/sodium antiporter [Bacteroidetes bacterium]|nr:calcium/sodium antiporter [Bacteroidota bacterium]
MLVNSIIFLIGLGILYFGAEWLVKGSSRIAARFGIRPIVIGLTVVALGTSVPELLFNVYAVFLGEDALAMGNIIGSNISNIALILGITAAIFPVAFAKNVLQEEYLMMLGVTALFYFLSMDGLVSRFDGIILLVGLAVFMSYVIYDGIQTSKKQREDATNQPKDSNSKPEPNSWLEARIRPHQETAYLNFLIVLGIAALAGGARLMVDSSVAIAQILQIAPIVIGLTIVAIGTSLPELAASLMLAFKKEGDMSVGNILGSNMLNILFVIGFVAVIRPIEVEADTIRFHFPVLMAVSLMLFPLVRKKYVLSRTGGILLMASFTVYVIWLIYPYL